MPDLTGLSFSQANERATNAGVQICMTGAITGNGVSQSQSIKAGEKVKQGTVITVNFVEADAVM